MITWITENTFTSYALLTVSVATGYLAASFFPADPGSPMWGSLNQQIHNTGGAVEYLGGVISLLLLSKNLLFLEHFYLTSIIVVFVGTVGLSIPYFKSFRGLLQRIAELVLFGNLILT